MPDPSKLLLPVYPGVLPQGHPWITEPQILPFELTRDADTGLVRQVFRQETADTLELLYEQTDATLSVPSELSTVGSNRVQDLVDFITSAIETWQSRTVLEIGCGTGYFLHTIQALGASVRGIEPGETAEVARQRGLQVDREFFDPESVGNTFDLVVLQTVLEHVPRPIEFLRSIRRVLDSGGLLALTVPDCEGQFRESDPGMIMHEHWNYFVPASLSNALSLSGFDVASLEKLPGGTLAVLARPTSEREVLRTDSNAILDAYLSGLSRRVAWFNGLASAAARERRDLVVYGASVGAANLLHMGEAPAGVHLVDGDEAKTGYYLPGRGEAIAPPTSIRTLNRPLIVILPIAPADAILEFLRSSHPPSGAEVASLKHPAPRALTHES